MFMPGGERVIVTVEGSQSIALVNVATGKVDAIATPDHPCHMVVPSPNGKRAYATSIWRGALVVLDLEKGEMIKAIATGGGAEGFDMAPDGSEIWVGNRADDTVSIVDADKLEVVETIDSKGFPIRLKFAMNGEVVLVSAANANAVRVYDAESRKELGSINMPEGATPIGILVAPNQRHAFIANTRANIVTVIDVETRSVNSTLKAGNTPDGMAWATQ
jgi:YVTN family beta-propeller protein